MKEWEKKIYWVNVTHGEEITRPGEALEIVTKWKKKKKRHETKTKKKNMKIMHYHSRRAQAQQIRRASVNR